MAKQLFSRLTPSVTADAEGKPSQVPSLIETCIDQTERRAWFLGEIVTEP
jgi:hypothetical protein